jgi:hypothetical protein
MKQPPLQPRSNNALRIGAVLPGNWELSETNNEILLVRKEQIRIYGCVGLDVSLFNHPDLFKEDVEKTGFDDDYKIRLRFARKVEPEEYLRLKETNDRIRVEKSTQIENREFFEDDAMRSFDPIYRELPEYYDEHSGIYLETTLFPWHCVYPEEVAIECANVRKELDSLFLRYSPADSNRTMYVGPAPLLRREQFPQPP